MNALLQKEDIIITVLCPKGHTLWAGIKLSTLWKKYGLRFGPKQCINKGYDYSGLNRLMRREGISETQMKTIMLDNRISDMKSTYQMTSQQTGWCSRKCKECETSGNRVV